MTLPAVFSGAGLSGAAPASMPLGHALRDRILDLMCRRAQAFSADLVTDEQRAELGAPHRKLEQVLGRLWRLIGDDALDCLLCLRPPAPNAAHRLAALHLARGGLHVTLNFDRGIEDAYAALAGAPPLRCVTSRAEFDAWVRDGRPPALLKPHGGLAPGATRRIDVVVEDTEEVGGLWPSRRAAIDLLGDAPELLVTGYGGLDPDVYGPLLEAARRTRTTWATIVAADEVRDDCRRLGIDLVEGHALGDAAAALRTLLGDPVLPPPPAAASAPPWTAAFDAWADAVARRHPPESFAEAWAWLLADTGDRDAAAELLRALCRPPGSPSRLRLADVLYDRAARNGRDRREALSIYGALAFARSTDWPTRAHCLLRIGGVARGEAVRRPGGRTLTYGVVALAAPVLVLVLGRRGEDAETVAAAHATLGQTALRFGEQAAIALPAVAGPAVAWVLRRAARRCAKGAALTANGNRRALATAHELLARSLDAWLRTASPDPDWAVRLRALADTYKNAGDLAGAGNCVATLAVLAAIEDAPAGVAARLDEAAELYREGRGDGRLIPSGAALLDRLRVILEVD